MLARTDSLMRFESGAQGAQARFGTYQQICRIPPVLQHLTVDRAFLAHVQRPAGDVLQAQTAIAIDIGALEPRPQIGFLTGVSRKQLHDVAEIHVAQTLRNAGALWRVETRLHRVDVDLCRVHLSQQHDVVAAAGDIVAPERAVGEDVEEGFDFALHGLRIALVERHPLSDHAGWIEMLLDQLKVFLGVERGAAFDPRVNGIAGDDVELFGGGENEMARVVINDLGARVVDDVVVLLAEIFGCGRRDDRLHFADDDTLHPGIYHEASRRDTRAEPDNQHGLGILVHERGHVAEHALQAHVVGFGGSFDLARDVELYRAIVPFRDGDGRVDAFARIENARAVERSHHAAPVGDEHAGYRQIGRAH